MTSLIKEGGSIQPPEAAAPAAAKTKVIVVTGLSGAGRSSVLDALEDCGYITVQSPPVAMTLDMASRMAADSPSALALSMDARSHGFTAEAALETIRALRAHPLLDMTVVFMDCEDDALIRRFSETRRRHVLSQDGDVNSGVVLDRKLTAPLKETADVVFDTSRMSLTDLRRDISDRFGLSAQSSLSVAIMSFGFKNGMPAQADIVFDVRFLSNPHWNPALRALTGESEAVTAYVTADPAFASFFEQFSSLLLSLMPEYRREGKSYLCVAIGCTGGKHRSVATARLLAERLRDAGYAPSLRHRDLPEAAQ